MSGGGFEHQPRPGVTRREFDAVADHLAEAVALLSELVGDGPRAPDVWERAEAFVRDAVA